MCKSMAEGGQRCISHATERMLRAQTRYEAAVAAANDPVATVAESAKARMKAAAAFEKFDEARIDYASTPQGEEDLRNRLAAVLAGAEVAPGVHTPSGKPLDNAVDLETAILAGRMVRRRNENRAKRYRESRALAALGDLRDGDVLTLNVGTADMDQRAYLPKGAHVRARVGHTGAPAGMVMVQRVAAPGENVTDVPGQAGARAGEFYLVPMASLAHPSEKDKAAEYLRAHPDHTGASPADDGFWNGTDDSLTAASGF